MTDNVNPSKRSDSIVERFCVFVEGRIAQNFITGLILINGLILGLETTPDLVGNFA